MQKTGSRKVAGYVKARERYTRLALKYQARLDALLPLKRKRDAAEVALKIKHQKMTGGELGKAQKIINARPLGAPIKETTA